MSVVGSLLRLYSGHSGRRLSSDVNVLADCGRRTGEQWLGFESTFDDCRVLVEPLTRNSFVLVISVDPRIGKS